MESNGMNTSAQSPRPQEPAFDDLIDGLADQFELAWTSESLLDLEEVLAPIPETIKETACQELLAMDMELRFKNGLPVRPDSYVRKFPQYTAEIHSAYQKVMEPRKLGEYEYYENIGSGGMGNVYSARHQLLDRIVAVKLLHGNILEKPGSADRFLREIRLSGQLEHPNMVSTEYAGKEKGRYYLVMKLVDGEDIRKIIDRQGCLPLPIACEILCQAAAGLQYASEHNIVHRDIKPGNIMISRDGVVKILDFGLGKFVNVNQPEADYSLTGIGSTLGSVDYIAPEQWEDAAKVSIQADIYSLGCTFFFLLTGRAPFEQHDWNREQRMIAHIKGEIPPLRQFCENVPEEIEACFRKMIAKNPKDRFAQPSEIIAVLTPFAAKDSLKLIVAEKSNLQLSNAATVVYKKQGFLPSAKTVLTKYLPRTIFLLVIGYGIYLAGSMKHHGDAVKPVPDNTTLTIERTNTDDSPVSPILSQSTLAETLQFAGYSGRWWFEEMPWYLPVIREAAGLSHEESRFFSFKNGDPEFISPFIPKSEAAKRLFDYLLSNKAAKINIVQEFEPLVNAYLSEQQEEAAASVLHTQAVLLHCLTELKNSTESGQQARELYAKAVQAYDAQGTEASRLLKNLCQFDAARLNWWFDGHPDEFLQQIKAIETLDTDDAAFRAELSAISAERLMAEGQNGDDLFAEAFALIRKAANSDPRNPIPHSIPHPMPHPMLESLHSRYAAALTRQWKLTAAEPHWIKAQELAIAAATATSSATAADHQNARLCNGAVRSRLALAVSARYFGDLNLARRQCRDLIGNIQDTLTYAEVSSLDLGDDKVRLTQQLAEAMEQLADCTLFVPTHFGEQPIPNSRFFVTEAESYYAQAHEIAADAQVKFVLQCKSALLQYCAGNIPDNEFDKIGEGIRNDYAQFSAAGSVQDRTTEYFKIAGAFFGKDKSAFSTVVSDNISRIRNWLDGNRLNNNLVDRYAGERLDLQLLCIRYLLTEELRSGDTLLRQDIGRYVDPILLQHLAPEKKMRPFLLPFYDLAVNCLIKNGDLSQTVLMIRAARNQRYSGAVPKALLVFYFPMDSENGFAVFLPTDQQDGKRFDLGFNRQQILDAAAKHQELQLPEELVSLVKQSWSQSVWIDVSWDDSVCWIPSLEKKRLTNSLWSFNSQLSPDLLWGIVR